MKDFEKQRIKNTNGDGSISGEKLSFKGRLGSVKCEENVHDIGTDLITAKREVDANA